MINLKGAAIGNGCWGNAVGTCSSAVDSTRIAVTFYFGHGMVSQQTWNSIIDNCGADWNKSSDACDAAVSDAMSNVGDIDGQIDCTLCPPPMAHNLTQFTWTH